MSGSSTSWYASRSPVTMSTSSPWSRAWVASVAMMSSASNPAASMIGMRKRLDDLAHEAHLLAEDVGRRAAVGLVVGDGFVAEGRLGPVERDADAVGLVVAHAG